MRTYKHLWKSLCSWDNLELAYQNARKHKTNNPKIRKFDTHWQYNLAVLLWELKTKTYKPKPLQTFVLRDPKTRVISVANFRDRIVHHALINMLQPIFEPQFIYDSFANRVAKGTLAALDRFDYFKTKVMKSLLARGDRPQGYVLKADIKQYFQTVDHEVLLDIISRQVKDANVIWLVRVILDNHKSDVPGMGMPLGNWTSQFFANVYLNELDQFVKHELRAKYYIRYVDDFVILHRSKKVLREYEKEIKDFLPKLKIELHPNKCKILPISQGISFLGFRVFPHHRIPRKRNIRKAQNRLKVLMNVYQLGHIDAWAILESWQGWSGYAMHGNTYNLRKKMRRELEVDLEFKSRLRKKS
ncbi:MAG: reverse transcriptase domain-containing protein [Candidatus Nanoarchaeia archaeon]